MKVISQSIVWFSLMFFFACSQEKSTDWKLNLNRNNKEPFGCYIAYQQLKEIFPYANISTTNNLISRIKKSNNSSSQKANQLSIAVLRNCDLNNDEFEEVLKYIDHGNSILILANSFSDTMLNFLEVKNHNRLELPIQLLGSNYSPQLDYANLLFINHADTLRQFKYKGLQMNSYFESLHEVSQYHKAVGFVDNQMKKNVLRYDNGGTLMMAHSPIMFTNHFMLQENNRGYYEYLLSCFNEYTEEIIWYSKLRHVQDDSENDNPIFKFPPLFKAFLIILALLSIYIMFESKRRQRAMPIIFPKENATLEFVETVGRLYYNKSDHQNLSEKMITYYLEFLRSQYGLKTHDLNDTFAHALALKLNQSDTETKAFVSYLNYIRKQTLLTETDIQHLQKQLNKFT